MSVPASVPECLHDESGRLFYYSYHVSQKFSPSRAMDPEGEKFSQNFQFPSFPCEV